MRRAVGLVGIALLLVACGDAGASTDTAPTTSEQPDTIVIRASSDLAVGPERVLLALATESGARLGGPDEPVTIAVYPEDEPSRRQEVGATWMWAVPDVSGLYRADVTFDRPGIWFAEVIPTGADPLTPVPLSVAEDPSTPAIGEAAPRSETPTASTAEEAAAITTDLEPDLRFYELSIAEAVTSGRPSVIVFATPKFCQTAICGPTLEDIKALVEDYPDANFLHVEVFDLEASPADATSIEELVVHPAVLEWGLPSEPWIFVVGEDGTVAGRFEGIVDAGEIAGILG